MDQRRTTLMTSERRGSSGRAATTVGKKLKLTTLSRTDTASWTAWKAHAISVIRTNGWGHRRAKLMVKSGLLGDAWRITYDVKPSASTVGGDENGDEETCETFMDRSQLRFLWRLGIWCRGRSRAAASRPPSRRREDRGTQRRPSGRLER